MHVAEPLGTHSTDKGNQPKTALYSLAGYPTHLVHVYLHMYTYACVYMYVLPSHGMGKGSYLRLITPGPLSSVLCVSDSSTGYCDSGGSEGGDHHYQRHTKC